MTKDTVHLTRADMWNQMQGQWHDYKGRLRQRWGELTAKDMDELAGARQEELSGKLQKAYNLTKEEADRRVSEWIEMEAADRGGVPSEGNPTSSV